LNRKITLGLLGLLSLSACGGSSSHTGNDMPADAGGSAGQAGSSGVAGTSVDTSSAGGGGASSGSAGRSAGSGGVSTAGSVGRGSGGSIAHGGSGSAGFDTGGSAGRGSAGSAGSVGSGGSAGAANKPTLGCAKWQLDLTAGNPSNATLVAGGVKLTRPVGTIRASGGYFNGSDVALEQTGLVGDFDITIGFKDFVPGDAVPFKGPRLTAGIWWHDVSGSIYQGLGTVGKTTGSAVLFHGDQFDINLLNPSPSSLVGASGTIHIKRVASVVTVETTVNSQVVSAKSASTEPFTEEPLTLFIGFDQSDADFNVPSAVESGATITSVHVTGGGGQVKSDDFSCP